MGQARIRPTAGGTGCKTDAFLICLLSVSLTLKVPYHHSRNIDYNLAWLRQEENQYLSVPPEVAAEMPVEIQRLVGYHTYSDALGCAWPFVSLSHPAQ